MDKEQQQVVTTPDLTHHYQAARDVLFNSKDNNGKWLFASCTEVAEVEWKAITEKISQQLFRHPDQFAKAILDFLNRLHSGLYQLDWVLIEKLVKKSFCCLVVKQESIAGSGAGAGVPSNVDISRLFQVLESAAVTSDTSLCFKAVFAAGVKLGKQHAPRLPSTQKKRSSSSTKKSPAKENQSIPQENSLSAVAGAASNAPEGVVAAEVAPSSDPVAVLESISTAPSLDSLDIIRRGQESPCAPPSLIQLPPSRVTPDFGAVTVADTKRKLERGDKVLILNTPCNQHTMSDYVGQVATVIGFPEAGNGWYKVRFNDCSERNVRGGSIAGETDCRPENMRRSSSVTSISYNDEDIQVGSVVVVTSGIMSGQEGIVRSIGKGWVKVETAVGKAALRPGQAKLVSNRRDEKETGANPAEVEVGTVTQNLSCRAHLTGLTAQLQLFGRRIFLGEFPTAFEASRAYDIAYIRCVGPRKVRERDLCHPLVEYAVLPESDFCKFDNKLKSELTGTLWRGLKECSRHEFLGNRLISEHQLYQTEAETADRSKKGMKTVSKSIICRRNLKVTQAEVTTTSEDNTVNNRQGSPGKRALSGITIGSRSAQSSPSLLKRKSASKNIDEDLDDSADISDRPVKRGRKSLPPDNAGRRDATSLAGRRSRSNSPMVSSSRATRASHDGISKNPNAKSTNTGARSSCSRTKR